MQKGKRHIRIDGFVTRDDFKSRRTGRNPSIPLQNRGTHGRDLSDQYSQLVTQYDLKRHQAEDPITDDTGIYVEIVGTSGCAIPLESLDTRDFKLRSCRKEGDHETALIFIPESRRHAFQGKLDQYLNPEKDGNVGPRNHNLIDSISEIKLANLRSFWTDPQELFPTDPHSLIWWELWLKKHDSQNNPLEIAQRLAERVNGTLGNTSLSFFESYIVLIKASVHQLERAPELIGCIEELRRAKETPNILIKSSPKDQQQWADNLIQRIQVDSTVSTSVVILDTGINYHHPLLSKVCNSQQAEQWNPVWPSYDDFNPATPLASIADHGSRQAGLTMFGDLHQALVSFDAVVLNHRLESARILPPKGNNDPELYGAITTDTVAKLEEKRPEWRRVYSLAVTADSERDGGQPSSWSAEIDLFTSGLPEGRQRLFIISAGNNRALSPTLDYWDQLHLAEIEDPAQSWNALTVGAYTEKTTNDDPDFDGWSPLARAGDVAPASRSSVNWAWRKHAPLKPDVVAEGGNRLLSPGKTEVSGADVVSLLTTSGRTTGPLFEVSADTSAACALVSREAAMIMAEYPEFWPETVRALLVHSAEWTDRMRERFGLLHGQHSPKVAKEIMLRSVGYGVPKLERALYSASHALTLVAQSQLQPFDKAEDAGSSADPTLNEMHLYRLPWPIEVLQQLPPELEVKLKVTLSYFVEPNPGRKGYRQRYSYQSHGLRFEAIRPGQSLDNFLAMLNGLAEADGYDGPEGDTQGWLLGPQLRTRGSLHSDTWMGSAAALADMHTIAICPVGGWWKYHTAKDRWRNKVRYSLIVSIDVPDETVDVYTVVSNLIETQIPIET